MGRWFGKDAFVEGCADRQERDRIERMPSKGGRVTRSVSAELSQKPDAYKASLMKAAERGDASAAERLAHMWKQEH